MIVSLTMFLLGFITGLNWNISSVQHNSLESVSDRLSTDLLNFPESILNTTASRAYHFLHENMTVYQLKQLYAVQPGISKIFIKYYAKEVCFG